MSPRRAGRTLPLALAALAALAAPASAAPSVPFTNGSFEDPDGPRAFRTVLETGDEQVIPGWVATGGVTWFNHESEPSNPAADGVRDVQVGSGGSRGQIEQGFSTSPQDRYRLTLALAQPRDCSLDTAQLDVQAGLTGPDTFVAGPARRSVTFDFRASSAEYTRLTLSTHAGVRCGPVVDDLRIVSAPPAVLEARAASRSARPVFESKRLLDGRLYTVTVRGTSSSWDRSIMAPDGQRARGWVVCGRPEAAPLVGGSSTDGRVGEDAAFLFALPQPGTRCRPQVNALLPLRQASLRFDLDGSGTFATVPTPEGDPSAPAADHTYTYVVEGEGEPLRIRPADTSPSDNSGRYEITVI